MTYLALENALQSALQLRSRPVAIHFQKETPDDAQAFEGQAPAGCSFWRLAALGEKFVTRASDHHECAIGSYTHNIPLPEERQHELTDTLSLMSEVGYLEEREVGGIPTLPESPGAVVYTPLGVAMDEPDVVLLVARPNQAMLIGEAVVRAGVASGLSLLARPSCMALPMALRDGVVASTGCVGNRVYTELDDQDLYVVIRGDLLGRIVEALATVTSANEALFKHHQARNQAFPLA